MTVEQNTVFDEPLDGPRQYHALHVAANGGEGFRTHGVVHTFHALLDDGALVQVARHKVGRGANQFHAKLMRLVVRLGAFEAG